MVDGRELAAQFENAADFETRKVLCGGQLLTVLFLDGLTSGGDIAEQVVRPLAQMTDEACEEVLYTRALQGGVWCASVKEPESTQQAAELLVNGFCVILFPKSGKALGCEVKTGEKRSPSPPETENTVKGAKDAFTETLRTNTSLVRRHLRTPGLRLTETVIGKRTLTKVTVCWIDRLTDPELPRRMQERLSSIDIDGALSPAAIEEYVTGSRRTAFPLLEYTERTDHFCQGLLDGQVGLLADGLPLGYLAPVGLGRLMRSPEDRATDFFSASMLRLLRYAALGVSLLLPALYAAMAMFHQQMLPTKLLLSIIESKQNVPFSTLLEVLGLLCAFELLQQAGLHLPQAVGTAVSIIGGLVVGTAAVDAKLVSPAALIVTASSGICGFTLPNRELSDAVRLWRFVLTVLAGLWGLFGVTVGLLLLLTELAGLESLGRSYLSPFGRAEVKGALVRPRLVRQKWRDGALKPMDDQNQR
ncbi:MAG: spore germination protein [Oscillospiraceae bacterium]|nr:spore germination protein [Clostridiales bacterium]MDY2690047.1 spore germination protein [Oscillospiraceae bacterium]